MDLRHLRYFVAVASELHFGRAAQRLHITQPPLSVGIRQLEDQLGFRLFHRDSKRVALTPTGQAFLPKAHELLNQVDKAEEFGAALAKGHAGHLDIGFTGAMLFRGLGEFLSLFEALHPHVEFSLHEGSSLEQKRLVRSGRLDAGFVNVGDSGDFGNLVCFKERYVVCLPEKHRFADCSCIDLASLRDERFVIFARGPSPGHYDHLIALCAQAGFEPRSRLEVQQFLSVAAMVASGLGISVVPASIARSAMPGVRFIALEGSEIQPTAFLIWDPKRETPGLDAFVDTLKQVLVRSELGNLSA
ncbi:LysR substrate-binding domain-containing protein [Verticiella sediminum]|uniref:LysR substrate-binding domain-containing protein n=1 Tax=Verticiella sediminum TaxID=1247510 RepID=UPI001FE9653C|nr:LysR substrate-binding domain-containing protein [Verticiella sediminum]